MSIFLSKGRPVQAPVEMSSIQPPIDTDHVQTATETDPTEPSLARPRKVHFRGIPDRHQPALDEGRQPRRQVTRRPVSSSRRRQQSRGYAPHAQIRYRQER
jgi:hypothetical protein